MEESCRNKEAVHKSNSDPGGIGNAGGSSPTTATTSSCRRHRSTSGHSHVPRKCVLTLDGYSYVIVASPPEKCGLETRKHGHADRHKLEQPTSSSSETGEGSQVNTHNGQLSKQGSLTIVRRSSTKKSPPEKYFRRGASVTITDDKALDEINLSTENLPAVDTPDACDKAALRLRCLLRKLQKGPINADLLQKNLRYAATVLEAVFIDETKDNRLQCVSEQDQFNQCDGHIKNSLQTAPLHTGHQRRRLRTPIWARLNIEHDIINDDARS